MEPESGTVVFVRTDKGPAIGLVKGPAFYDVKNTRTGEYVKKREPFTLVYVPGIGDTMAWPKNILAVNPPCSTCAGTKWYWRGSDVLFPDAIICATCNPPMLTKEEIRCAIEEIIDLLVNKDVRFTRFKDSIDEWGDEEWPSVQKRLFRLWMLLLCDIGDIEDTLFPPIEPA